jgi:predicted NAD-dependent protein-ADP-ribosyltransferase YbiA (DUF1768 family)
MGVSISEFRGEYYFLSNFYSAPVTYNGMCFENNEAAFQAAKCPERMTEFCRLNPSEAKRLGRRSKIPLCMRFARQSSHRILIWQTSLLRPRMPNSLKAILGATASGASVMALEKIALVKSLCGSEQKCDVNYEEG